MFKRLSAIAGVSLILVMMGAGCMRRSVPPAKPYLPTSEAVPVTETKPVAYVRMENASAMIKHGEETLPAEDGVELQAGDQLTSVSGTVSIVYPNTGVSEMEPGTSVEILADDQGEGLFAQVRVLTGSIWTRLERLLGKDESFSVAGAGVVATVRGTAFGVTVNKDVIDVQVVDHAVEMSADEPLDQMVLNMKAKKNKFSLSLPAGQAWLGTGEIMRQKDDKAVRKLIRTMKPDEEKRDGFQFAMKPVPHAMMQAPQKLKRLKWKKEEKPEAMQDRLQTLRELRATMMQQ